MKWKVLVAILVVLLVSTFVYAQTTGTALSEDGDGDGMPTVVEEHVGTDPDDSMSCISAGGLAEENVLLEPSE